MNFGGSIAFKVALILCIPVFFEIAVIGTSMHLLGEIDKARVERKEVSKIVSLYAGMLGIMMRDYIRFLTTFSDGNKISQKEINQLYARTYKISNKLGQMGVKAGFKIEEIDKKKQQVDRRFPLPVHGMDEKLLKKQMMHYNLLHNLIAEANKSIKDRAVIVEVKEKREKELFWKMNLLLLAALAASILLTLSLCFLINRLLLERLSAVTENTKRLALDKPLLPDLRGNDEVSQLDRTFRKMADALALTRERDQLILDNSSDIIAAIDETFVFRKVSKASELIWQMSEEDLVDHHISEVIKDEHKIETVNRLDGLKESNTVARFESETIASDGTLIPCLWSVKWSAEEKLFIAVIHDSRNKKEAEAKRQELLAMVSHDLRSPLTTATLSLETLLKDKDLDQKSRSQLAKAKSSIDHVVSITNDLLDLIRIQQNKLDMNLKLFNLKECRRLIENSLQDRNVHCNVVDEDTDKTYFILDEDYFSRILQSLTRHMDLSGEEGEINIDIGPKESSVVFKLKKDESNSQALNTESRKSLQVSWEISLGLIREILNTMKGELTTTLTEKGAPEYSLVLPVCELDQDDD